MPNTLYSPTGLIYLGILNGIPTDTTVPELRGGNYQRLNLSDPTNWAYANGIYSNVHQINFPIIVSSDGSQITITGFALFDAVTNGNILVWSAIVPVVLNNNPLIIPIGQLQVFRNISQGPIGPQGVSGTVNNTIAISGFVSNPTLPIVNTCLTTSSSSIACAFKGVASQSVPLTAYSQLSSTSTPRNCGYIDASFNSKTDSSWTGILSLYAGDHWTNGAAKRLGIQVQSSGQVAQIGLFGAPPVSQQTPNLVTAGYTTGNSIPVTLDGKFTGGVGGTSFTIADIVASLKNIGILKK